MCKKLIVVVMLLAFATAAEATIKLKIAVVNPSGTVKQTTPIKYDLPKGIEPANIVDKGEMELGYDFDKGSYYVYQNVTLEPSEKKVLVIEIEDIWFIPDKDIDFLKAHTSSLAEKLEGTAHADVGSELAVRIEEKLDGVSKSQKNPNLSAREKMNLYYENVGNLDAIKDDIGMLENLVLDIGGVVEDRVRVPETLAVAVPLGKGIGPWEIIEYKIGVSNPSTDRKQVMKLKQHLPEEVTPSAVLEAGGLEVGYDFAKECFYVFKDVELEPSEKKEFVVKLKDIWRVPEVEIEALRSHTKNLALLLEETDYAEEAKEIENNIFYSLEEIEKSQNLKVPPPEHIAFYRQNLEIFEKMKEEVAKLEKMATQSGSTPGVTIAKAERLEGGGKEMKRARGYEGLILIAQTIFRGKAPTVATTWKIIFTIVGFVAVLSVAFFALWHAQVLRERRRAEERKHAAAETKPEPELRKDETTKGRNDEVRLP